MKKYYEEPQIEVRKYNIVENKHILTGVSITDPIYQFKKIKMPLKVKTFKGVFLFCRNVYNFVKICYYICTK